MRTLVVAAIAASLAVIPSATAETASYPVAHWMNRACPTEDSVNCFWDAKHRGNHKGDSFYVRHMPASNVVCVMYPAKPWLDYCDALRT